MVKTRDVACLTAEVRNADRRARLLARALSARLVTWLWLLLRSFLAPPAPAGGAFSLEKAITVAKKTAKKTAKKADKTSAKKTYSRPAIVKSESVNEQYLAAKRAKKADGNA